MVISIGILLIGGHFLFLVAIAHFCASFVPVLGPFVLLFLAVLSGLAIVNVQTWLEAIFIGRHLKRNPRSRWNVVAFGTTTERAAYHDISKPDGSDKVHQTSIRRMLSDAFKRSRIPTRAYVGILRLFFKRWQDRLGLLRQHFQWKRHKSVVRVKQPRALG